tara:strand:+ start:346 stop:525 length:180 start_codon:yes stop_codon:yes gene_type:complete
MSQRTGSYTGESNLHGKAEGMYSQRSAIAMNPSNSTPNTNNGQSASVSGRMLGKPLYDI